MKAKYELLMSCAGIFGLITGLTGLANFPSFFFILPAWLWIPTYSAIAIFFGYLFVSEQVSKTQIIGEEPK